MAYNNDSYVIIRPVFARGDIPLGGNFTCHRSAVDRARCRPGLKLAGLMETTRTGDINRRESGAVNRLTLLNKVGCINYRYPRFLIDTKCVEY